MSAERKRQRRTGGTPSPTEKAWHDDLLRRYEAMIGEWRRAHNPTTHPEMKLPDGPGGDQCAAGDLGHRRECGRGKTPRV
jgi:hypothetical protein